MLHGAIAALRVPVPGDDDSGGDSPARLSPDRKVTEHRKTLSVARSLGRAGAAAARGLCSAGWAGAAATLSNSSLLSHTCRESAEENSSHRGVGWAPAV